MLLVVALCIGVCALGLQNGIENITKKMMLALIVLMAVMAVNSVMLKGSSKGLSFYLIPNLENVKKRGLGNVIFDAMTQAFFTLSVGMGSMEIFGSYLGKERKLTGEAINVLVLDTLIAFVAGIIVIPACISFGIRRMQDHHCCLSHCQMYLTICQVEHCGECFSLYLCPLRHYPQ